MSNCGPDPESDPKQVEILEKEIKLKYSSCSECGWSGEISECIEYQDYVLLPDA